MSAAADFNDDSQEAMDIVNGLIPIEPWQDKIITKKSNEILAMGRAFTVDYVLSIPQCPAAFDVSRLGL